MNSVVYAIRNMDNMKMYVGSSKVYPRRMKTHLFALNHNEHYNGHLQGAWNKYGEHAFVFSVLEVVDEPNVLRDREQWWLDHLNPYKDNGYNIHKDVRSDYEYSTPEEVREKLRIAMTGYKRTPEHCKNIAKAKLGHTVSEETKAKISKNRKGKHVGHPCYSVRPGSANNKAKLHEDDIPVIRQRLASGEIGAAIARDYDVNKSTIYQVKNQKTWKHI